MVASEVPRLLSRCSYNVIIPRLRTPEIFRQLDLSIHVVVHNFFQERRAF